MLCHRVKELVTKRLQFLGKMCGSLTLFVEKTIDDCQDAGESWCGWASEIGADSDESFAVVRWDCASALLSSPHEVGHLQGARHDPYNDSNNTPYAYGHGYVNVANRWRTIMAYNDECDYSDEVSPCPDLNSRSTPRWPYCSRLKY